MTKTRSGFTLVEIMAVIVIIAILATVTLVTYNGVTTRARTGQTVSAAGQWIKTLQVYRARNGGYPAMSGCLGSSYGYNMDGLGSSGIGQCRQDSASSGITSNTTLNTALATYLTGQPTPAMITGSNTATNWRRGLYYYVDTSAVPSVSRVEFVLEGGLAASDCPTVGQLTATTATTYANGNTMCSYLIGNTSGY